MTQPARIEAEGTPEQRMQLIFALRSHGVTDPRVLDAFEKTPRAAFLDRSFKDRAWEDLPLPIACGQTISQPAVVAMMTEALALEPHMRVLEIGTGSGYQAAILARLAAEVVSVERYRALSDLAAARLAVLRITNVSLQVADGHEGWPEGAPYDRIIVTAAAAAVPAALVEQLAPEGILVAPVGPQGGVQELMRCRHGAGGLVGERIADVRFVPLTPGVAEIL